MVENRVKLLNAFELGLWVKENITELLEKERGVIIDAYHINPNESVFGNVGSDYFTKTFTDESK